MYNFNQQPNEKWCSCGRHSGVGEWSPEQRAAFYKRMIVKMPQLCSNHHFEFVKDWEMYHGVIRYTMGVVCQNPGTINKADKGKDVWGPIFLENAKPQADIFSPN